MRRLPVGKSSRTPFKHWILNSELGRLCGIFKMKAIGKASNVHAKATPFHVVDMCAGDGVESDSKKSSPSIITHHLSLLSASGVDVKSTFIEKNTYTFQELCRNIDGGEWSEFIHGDSREFAFPSTHKHQAVFVHADPNSIADWPITPEFLASLTDTTTMLATLGCNVGGLKRLAIEDRAGWFEHVRLVVDMMPSYHDALLIALDGDAAQWAYLLQIPLKWLDATANAIQKKGQRLSDYPLSMASVRQSRDEFERMQIRLFLTKEERGEK